jgi:hypothetical protein
MLEGKYGELSAQTLATLPRAALGKCSEADGLHLVCYPVRISWSWSIGGGVHSLLRLDQGPSRTYPLPERIGGLLFFIFRHHAPDSEVAHGVFGLYRLIPPFLRSYLGPCSPPHTLGLCLDA